MVKKTDFHRPVSLVRIVADLRQAIEEAVLQILALLTNADRYVCQAGANLLAKFLEHGKKNPNAVVRYH